VSKILALEPVNSDMGRPFREHTALFLAGKDHNGTLWLFDQIYSIRRITWFLSCLNSRLLWLYSSFYLHFLPFPYCSLFLHSFVSSFFAVFLYVDLLVRCFFSYNCKE